MSEKPPPGTLGEKMKAVVDAWTELGRAISESSRVAEIAIRAFSKTVRENETRRRRPRW